MKKLMYGVATDDHDYLIREREYYRDSFGKIKERVIWSCPFYSRWRDLIRRCYSEACLKKCPNYLGTFVCEEWLVFSNFKKWMEGQDWEGKHLDKDLLGSGKLYSPETCVFIPPKINTFMAGEDRLDTIGKLVGTTFQKDCGMYRAQCNDPFSGSRGYIGLFCTEIEAHNAWRDKKLLYAKLLACSEYITSTMIGDALIKRYSP